MAEPWRPRLRLRLHFSEWGAAKALEKLAGIPKRWIDKCHQQYQNGERPRPAIAAMLKRAMEGSMNRSYGLGRLKSGSMN